MHRGRRRGSRSDKALQKKRAAGTGGYVAWLICGSSRAVFTCTQRSHAAPAVEIAWRQQGSPCSRKSCHCPHCRPARRLVGAGACMSMKREMPTIFRPRSAGSEISPQSKSLSSSGSPVEAKQPVRARNHAVNRAPQGRDQATRRAFGVFPIGMPSFRFIGAMLLDQDTPATSRRHHRLLTLTHLKIAYHI